MLTRFLRSNAEFLPSRLYVAYLDMLGSLSGNSQSAAQCFHFLNSNSSSGGEIAKSYICRRIRLNVVLVFAGSLSALSWSQLFNSLNRYYQTLKTEYVTAQTAQSIPTIAPTELKALMSWLKVTQKVCENVSTFTVTVHSKILHPHCSTCSYHLRMRSACWPSARDRSGQRWKFFLDWSAVQSLWS